MNKLKYMSAILIISLPFLSDAAFYRWIDAEGVTHYSSSVPPKAAQRGHIELDKSGLKKKTIISAKKKRALEIQRKEIEKLKKAEEKARKAKAKQEEEEIQLLSIFSSEDEVVKTYNSKLRMAQLTIDLLKSRHNKQTKKLEIIERKAERSKNIKHKRLLEKQIEIAIDNLSIYQQAITENIVEKDRVRKEFNTTLSKLKKLIAKQNSAEKHSKKAN